ncbi:coleoptile phototropism protein 1-like [Hordeum vulgare subsp. vulgare]|uniref:coleoptile phototropism protein 1-like n=1 Tax=Hordeum vulgare subsp. vulgare TaxID=112509 RepID=UPI001D1A58A2|nr:coleoptile phototropism protein 1-like [Hordeum vulgare subsp. vulgare]
MDPRISSNNFNIFGLRRAAEYLEMTEDLEEGNLIFKTEAFLSYVVLSSRRDSIVVLKSCEGLSPLAENLQIVRRCSESIAWKACANPASAGPTSAPPVAARPGAAPARRAPARTPSSSATPAPRSPALAGSPCRPPDWWFKDDAPHVVGGGVDEQRAQVSAAGGLHMIIAGPGGKDDVATSVPAHEQCMVVESLIIIIIPLQRDNVSCGFLLRVLRLAIMLKTAPALVTELEKRVRMQFEQAALPDLLIPSAGRADTAYDVDLMKRLVEHFLVQEQTKQVPYSAGRGEAHAQPEREYYRSAADRAREQRGERRRGSR